MNKNTVYILQKDLPYVKAGVEYKFDGEHYVCDETSKFTTDIYSDRLHKKSVENNLEWFKPKEEQVNTNQLFTTLDGCAIFKGDTYFSVDDNFNILFTTNAQQEYKDAGWQRAFSTYDAAQYWVSENKPKEEVNESKPTEQFKWDDKLVTEIVAAAHRDGFSASPLGIHDRIEKFKQSKSKKEEPQWEILEFKNLRSGIVYIKKDNGKFNSGNGLDWDLEKFDIKDHEIINSVKRFPDNTVWSVDMVTEHGIITAFKIVGSTMVAEIKNNIFPYDYPLYLSELKAPKEEQVPIKVEGIMEIGLGQPQDKKGHIYMLTLVGNSKIPYEKTESIIQSINNELNKK